MDESKEFLERVVGNQNRVYRFILTLVLDHAEADDLLQQTLLTLWEKRDQFDPSREFLPWAFSIARNHVRNYVKKCARRGNMVALDERHMERISELQSRSSDRSADRSADCRNALEKCMQNLSPDHRSLVEHYYDGRESAAKIASRWNMSVDAFYKILQRSRKALFDCVRQTMALEGER